MDNQKVQGELSRIRADIRDTESTIYRLTQNRTALLNQEGVLLKLIEPEPKEGGANGVT